MSRLGNWIQEELNKVKVKNNDEKRLRVLREKKLEALLTGKKARQFADPAARMRGK